MRWLVVPLVALVALAFACGEETIVLATAAPEDAGTTTRFKPTRCLTTSDCKDDDYCSKPRCDVSSGECKHKPLFCDNDAIFDPVCGCTSGITYFNECYRKQAGEESSTEGECEQNQRICDDVKNPCPDGATCRLIGGGPVDSPACGPPVGRCWGIITCPPAARGDYSECSTSATALKCVDACTAIQTGRKFTKEGPGCLKGP